VIVEVYRGAGDRIGDPITVPLLSDAVLVTRGRAEMDAHAHQAMLVTLDIVPRPGVRLGQIIEAIDPTSATALRGKVTGVKIKVASGGDGIGPRFDHVLTVEVPV